MSIAYRCDRCGKLYVDNDPYSVYALYDEDRKRIDLCTACRYELFNWMDFKSDEDEAEKYIKPRLQGHWEIYTDMNADKTCTCSNCNRYIVYFREHDKPFDYDYCPYCGSYMKEEVQNDD